MDDANYKLIIFDVDGTLIERESQDLLPGVLDWFEEHAHEQIVALATNQGGAGLRHWMERDGFGKPGDYPDERTIWSQLDELHKRLPELETSLMERVYVCFVYQSKRTGKWSPTPPGCEGRPEWDPANRKPRPGLLAWAMADANAAPGETLMVGNDTEDEQAASAAGCAFQWAGDFFAPFAG